MLNFIINRRRNSVRENLASHSCNTVKQILWQATDDFIKSEIFANPDAFGNPMFPQLVKYTQIKVLEASLDDQSQALYF